MTTTRKPWLRSTAGVRTIKTLLTGTVAGALVLGGGISAAQAETLDRSETALSQFRANLTAATDIAAFDTLTAEQRAELASYLLGESDPISQLSEAEPTDGDFELRISAPASTPGPSLMAAGSTRSVSAWQSFLFAGITISKTSVGETYYYSGANATGIASYSCVVDANYDPFSQVTSAKSGAWISSGKAVAECRVTVKRGVPSPWGPISWSTASNIQYVSGNGYGNVTSHGWH